MEEKPRKTAQHIPWIAGCCVIHLHGEEGNIRRIKDESARMANFFISLAIRGKFRNANN